MVKVLLRLKYINSYTTIRRRPAPGPARSRAPPGPETGVARTCGRVGGGGVRSPAASPLRRSVEYAGYRGPGPDIAADEMEAVALQRIAFAAQQSDAVCPGRPQQAIEALAELGLRHPDLVGHGGCMPLAFRRLAAELSPKKEVAEACVLEQPREPLLAEVRHETRIRARAHVGHRLNPVPPQKCQEVLDGMVRVPDRVELRDGRPWRPGPAHRSGISRRPVGVGQRQ